MQIQIEQWNERFEELWRKRGLLIIFLISALLFDTFSTIHCMTIDGIHLELNPLVKYSALFLDPIVGTFLSAFCYKIIVIRIQVN
ncbi:MAG: hypothetical protein ACYSU8_11170 [Planctomycetota bacterium]|jgi:hypothetical protein